MAQLFQLGIRDTALAFTKHKAQTKQTEIEILAAEDFNSLQSMTNRGRKRWM